MGQALVPAVGTQALSLVFSLVSLCCAVLCYVINERERERQEVITLLSPLASQQRIEGPFYTSSVAHLPVT